MSPEHGGPLCLLNCSAISILILAGKMCLLIDMCIHMPSVCVIKEAQDSLKQPDNENGTFPRTVISKILHPSPNPWKMQRVTEGIGYLRSVPRALKSFLFTFKGKETLMELCIYTRALNRIIHADTAHRQPIYILEHRLIL